MPYAWLQMTARQLKGSGARGERAADVVACAPPAFADRMMFLIIKI
jgi:uncharacterized protein YfaQ (DUF2300 family)